MSNDVNARPGRSGPAHEDLGPFCQSCELPFQAAEDFGTTAEGVRQNDYCHFCFSGGEFTEPDITFERMLEKTITMGAAATRLPAETLRAAVTPLLPRLKRWRGQGSNTGGSDG